LQNSSDNWDRASAGEFMANAAPICTTGGTERADALLIAFVPVRVLLLCAKQLLFVTTTAFSLAMN
jgi:hypothetical protein